MLMQKNSEFCIAWANAQLKAGATAICYFDPLASSFIIDKELYRQTGYRIAQQTLAKVNGPTAIHLASAPALPMVDEIAALGAKVLGFSCVDDVAEIKQAAHEKNCLLGNLNGIAMTHWSCAQAEQEVKSLLRQAAPGGGLILSDSHCEIPWPVKEEVLLCIAEAVERWGTYPLACLTESA